MIDVPKDIPLPEFVGMPKPVIQMSSTLAQKINEIISAIAAMSSGPSLALIDLTTIIPNVPTVPPVPISPPKQPFQASEQILKKGIDLGSLAKTPDISSIQQNLTKSIPSADSLKSLVPASAQSAVESAASSLPKVVLPKVDTSKVISSEIPKVETVKKFVT